jgi:hypothetical protein
MQSHSGRIRRPLTDEELDSESVEKNDTGENDMNEVVQKISLDNISLEERRKEAKKPLYLVRYE